MRLRLENPFCAGVRATSLPITVSGAVAYESVNRTRTHAVGGSAVHFALSARFLAPVEIEGIVGRDFGTAELTALERCGVSTLGIGMVDGETARYGNGGRVQSPAMANGCRARRREREVTRFDFVRPNEPTSARHAALETVGGVVDSRCALGVRTADRLLMLTTRELQALSGMTPIVRAARALQRCGPAVLVVTHGEYGASAFADGFYCKVPAFPFADVVDTTGARASFAGGLMGALAAQGGECDDDSLRVAMVCAAVLASFTVEAPGCNRCRELSLAELASRYEQLVSMIEVR